MADFKELIKLIEDTVNDLNKSIPKIQKDILDEVLLLIKDLETDNGNIRTNTGNLKIIADIKSKLEVIILNPEYKQAVKNYVGSFAEITKLQNEYFREIEDKFKPPKIQKELLKQAKEDVVSKLTESGIEANLVEPVKDIIRKAITSGSSYKALQAQLTNYLSETDTEGQLVRYTKQISTDAINQFSRQYSNLISSDLGLEWFRYSGSNIKTTRPFCLACTDRKYFHISEIPQLLKGDFPEFKKYDGELNSKTGLPQGMYPETDVSNFYTLLGGYNCGHQYRPVSEDMVPENIKAMVARAKGST